MLRDLETLGNIFQKRCEAVPSWPELSFNAEDQIHIKSAFSNLTITKISSHSLELRIDGGNSCIIPSQYFAYAVIIKEFAIVLFEYLTLFDILKNNNGALATNLHENTVDLACLGEVDAYSLSIFLGPFQNLQKRMEAKNIVNYRRETGYILRSSADFYGSVILKVVNVPDASSGILGKLIYELAGKNEEYRYFENRLIPLFSSIIKSDKVEDFVEQILRFLEQTDELNKVIESLKNNTDETDLFSIEEQQISLKSILKASRTLLSEAELTMGSYFVEPFLYGGFFYYLSRNWTCGDNGKLDLVGFEAWFNSKFVQYRIEIINDEYILKHNGNFPHSSPLMINAFKTALTSCKIQLHPSLPVRFIASLLTNHFTILTGLAGSGKTKLAEAFSKWISTDESKQICMVAVGADWANREPLLGYPNALNPGEYIIPDNRVLELLINAEKDENNPYFLILDEMNMSHVERYFADFLSAMESDSKEIKLHARHTDCLSPDKIAVPSRIIFKGNVFIIGTVNIDETTYMFSPKVLDRAQVIEFRVSEKEMEEYLRNAAPVEIGKLKGQGASMGTSFVAKAKDKTIKLENYTETLLPFFGKLQEAGAEFGYRTAYEISRFIAICTDIAGIEMDANDIADAAIMQKLLPKIHGSRNKIEGILKILAMQCLVTPQDDPFKDIPSDEIEKKKLVKYLLSYEKIKRMHDRVIKDGFTSYAEA